MDGFSCSRCPNNCIDQLNITEYLKVAPLPSWWQKLELKDLSISEPFEELLSWNLESKLITPKYITGTYFSAMVAILNFCDYGAGIQEFRIKGAAYIVIKCIITENADASN